VVPPRAHLDAAKPRRLAIQRQLSKHSDPNSAPPPALFTYTDHGHSTSVAARRQANITRNRLTQPTRTIPTLVRHIAVTPAAHPTQATQPTTVAARRYAIITHTDPNAIPAKPVVIRHVSVIPRPSQQAASQPRENPADRKGRMNTAVSQHILSARNPIAAQLLQTTYSDALTPGTHSKYHTAVWGPNGYATIMAMMMYSDLAFPACPISIAFWLTWSALFISIETLRGYMTGLHNYHTDHDLTWAVDRKFMSRIWSGLARHYGIAVRQLKESITPEVLRAFATAIDFNSHNDRVFFAACCLGTFCCLRGGEFLWSHGKNTLKMLTVGDVTFTSQTGSAYLHLRETKTLWMLKHLKAPIPTLANDVRCPVTRIKDMLERSPRSIPSPDKARALFMLDDGAILSIGFMCARADDLMRLLGIRGPHPLNAKSWRAGGVLGALRAGIAEAMVCELGRFVPGSTAFLSYLCSKDSDAQFTAEQMALVGSKRKASTTLSTNNPIHIITNPRVASTAATPPLPHYPRPHPTGTRARAPGMRQVRLSQHLADYSL
jgi:hypothetical protein